MAKPPLDNREKSVYSLLSNEPISARELKDKLVTWNVTLIRSKLGSLERKGYAKRSTAKRKTSLFGDQRMRPTIVWTKA